MSPSSASRLPRQVLFSFVGLTVVGLAAAFAYSIQTGWVPPRAWSTFVLPFYFAALLATLTLSFIASGNTLMHHFRLLELQVVTWLSGLTRECGGLADR
jgi:hypothetical protein